jgi:hypothetical protein
MERMEEVADHVPPIIRAVSTDPVGRIAPVPRLGATSRWTREDGKETTACP